MIKINLAPIEELDSQFWYIPDLLVFALFFGVASFGVWYYLDQLDQKIQVSYDSKAKMESSIAQLAPEVTRNAKLTERKKSLGEKADSLRNITKVKLARYMPVIVLEHIQNMKPMGLWFTSLGISDQGGSIEMEGSAMSNDLVAEYIKILKGSNLTQIDPNDLRTQVYFHADNLAFTKVTARSERFPEIENVVNFQVTIHAGTHRVHNPDADKDDKKTKNKKKKS